MNATLFYQSALPFLSVFAYVDTDNTTYYLFVFADYSGYDAALYNAATLYVQQQAHTTPKGAASWKASRPGVGATIGQKPKLKQPPKPQQLHYCDVCKISCAGPQVGHWAGIM